MQFKITFGSMYFLFSFLLCTSIIVSFDAIAEESTQREEIAISVFEYPPFLMESDEHDGIEPALVRLAFERMGFSVKFVFVPPARAIEMAKLGQVDATLGWVRSDEREAAFYFSEIIAQAPLVFFHLKQKDFEWRHYGELKGKVIGTVNKFYYGPAFHKAQQSGLFQVDAVSDDILNLKKLIAGRIDLTPINLYVGYQLARELFDAGTAERITHHPRYLKQSEHHLLLPKVLGQSARRLSLFNRGLYEIKQSGEFQGILDRYSPEKLAQQDLSIDLASIKELEQK